MEDRDLVTRVLQSMSNQIAGRSNMATLLPGEEYLPSEIAQPTEPDVPDGPGEAVADDTDPAAPAPKPATSGSQAWGGYENGRIPTKALKAIGQGSHKLETSAADAWIAMRDAAKQAGITLSLTDSYRTYDAQVAVRKNKGHLVATATPGTSVHGWGRAVDANVKDPKTLAWLRANGPKFGWVNPAWAQKGGKSHEPWHWEFQGGAS